MRFAAASFLLFVLAGCTRFEHPIIGEQGPTLDPGLVGRWVLDNDEGHYEIEVRPDGDGGVVHPLIVAPKSKDEKIDDTDMRLITARVGNLSFGSARSDEHAADGWTFFRYRLEGEKLIVIFGDDDYWKDAVSNGTLAGALEKGKYMTTANVTATGDELREFLLGFAPVIYLDEPDPEFEFTRAR